VNEEGSSLQVHGNQSKEMLPLAAVAEVNPPDTLAQAPKPAMPQLFCGAFVEPTCDEKNPSGHSEVTVVGGSAPLVAVAAPQDPL
jgi:hypothetical protein